MMDLLANLNMSRQFFSGLIFTCLCFGFGFLPVSVEGGESNTAPASTSQKDSSLSNDNLQKQISDLDVQIQNLRKQSLELQEKTRAKLQVQLDGLKQQRDTLLPRVEKLRDNSEAAWQDIKENIQKAIEDLKSSVDSMEK